jgi:hypothetical protein
VSSERSRQALVEEEVTREGSSSSFEIKFCFSASQSVLCGLLLARKTENTLFCLTINHVTLWKHFYSKIEVST